ncbi:protein disulfide-isomerase precursor [Apophysomyces sp. BC1034]|nr:protein disulfide-isomerase precursor [Apophysomyces sp. BC1015]KAG0181446.1 protein disulfide-isomerase precursor [Apophysomyces sp. BC1021]KAG0191889.1 protein disulfide-isomerase precursor [Apophysomyces sp. BC1034]
MVKKTLLWTALATTFAALTQTVLADSDVISLTKDDFDKQVLGEDLMLVEFFAPWCGHCKALAPEYEKAATELKPKNVKLAKVDCTENQDLCQDYEVRGYPTLKLFRKGDTTEYKGPRKADGIVSYMQKQAAPALSAVTPENFEEFKTSDRVVVVGYAASTDEASKETLQKLANSLRDDYLFGLTTDEALAKEHGIEKLPAVVLYKKFDEGRNDHVGKLNEEEIEQFVKTNSVPLLDEVDASNFQFYAESGLPLAYVFADSEEMLKPLVEAVKPVAKQYKGKVNFVHIDATKYGAHAGNLGLKEEWPAFAIQRLDTGAKFPLDQSLEITNANVQSFVDDYVSGKIKPSLKSEDIPAENDGPVKVVVGKEFNDIVMDKSKDVFLEVYAPWCGHCKNLAPTWVELGELVKKQDPAHSVVIAKMDGTENDIPEDAGFSVAGFPTLKFFKAESNEIVDYEGGRTLDDLLKFLNEHGSKGVQFAAEEKTDAEKEAKEEDDVTGHDEL